MKPSRKPRAKKKRDPKPPRPKLREQYRPRVRDELAKLSHPSPWVLRALFSRMAPTESYARREFFAAVRAELATPAGKRFDSPSLDLRQLRLFQGAP